MLPTHSKGAKHGLLSPERDTRFSRRHSPGSNIGTRKLPSHDLFKSRMASCIELHGWLFITQDRQLLGPSCSFC